MHVTAYDHIVVISRWLMFLISEFIHRKKYTIFVLSRVNSKLPMHHASPVGQLPAVAQQRCKAEVRPGSVLLLQEAE